VTRAKRADRLESALRHADKTLEAWFRQSKKTSRQASVDFARFLRRAKRQSAVAFRHQVDDLQSGLKKLSAGLQQLERGGKAGPAKRRARPAIARKTASSSKAASPRKKKKAA